MPTALLSPIYKNVIRNTGDIGTPWDIQRRRQWNLETMRRVGTPVLIKHMFTMEDVEKGIAEPSSNWDSIYGQASHRDELSHGIGFVSTQKARNEWIVPATEEEEASLYVPRVGEEVKIPDTYLPAPLYRGFGPGYLTYVILPDARTDVFKLSEEGTFIRLQQSKVQLPWYPNAGDNDLLITVELNAAEEIINTFERYTLKQVFPQTMRGRDRWGRREGGLTSGGNRFTIGQECEASLIPPFDPIYEVETDR